MTMLPGLSGQGPKPGMGGGMGAGVSSPSPMPMPAAGMPPMSPDPSQVPPPPATRSAAAAAGGLKPSAQDVILSRQDRAVKRIVGPVGKQSSIISPQEQLNRYRMRTADTSWVDSILGQVKDQNAAWMLKAIRDHGWEGVADYVVAMRKLKEGGGV